MAPELKPERKPTTKCHDPKIYVLETIKNAPN